MMEVGKKYKYKRGNNTLGKNIYTCVGHTPRGSAIVEYPSEYNPTRIHEYIVSDSEKYVEVKEPRKLKVYIMENTKNNFVFLTIDPSGWKTNYHRVVDEIEWVEKV